MTSDSDIIIIDVSNFNINSFQIINIYNEKNLDLNSDENSYTVKKIFNIYNYQKKLWLLMILMHIIISEIHQSLILLKLIHWLHD